MFKAELVVVEAIDSGCLIDVLSEGTPLQLLQKSSSHPILCVIDKEGRVIRSVHAWLGSLRAQVNLSLSPNTPEQYGRAITYFIRWLEANPPYPELTLEENISLLNREHVGDWLRAMSSAGAKSKKTLQVREVALRRFLDWLTTIEGGRVRDPENSPWGRDNSLRYVTSTPNARTPKFISTEMVIQLLLGMHNECERCMFHAQYDMGLRISELIGLARRDLPDENNYDSSVEFIPVCIKGVKGRGGQSKERVTLISRAALKRIKKYHSSLEYKLAPDWEINSLRKPVFLTVNQLGWSVRNASKQFKSAVRRSGLPMLFKTHWLRHGAAYSVLRSDMGKTYQDRMLLIQKMLGHSNLSTTEIYTNMPPSILQSLTKKGIQMDRLGEAEDIREKTYLGPLKHSERRGHRD